jgi:hypothetical protein
MRPLCGLTPSGRTSCVQNCFTILLNQWVQIQHPLGEIKNGPVKGPFIYLAERVGFEPTKGY